MFVVVTYDIAQNHRRLRLMKMLKGYGEHVQESVFECDLERGAYREMLHKLRAIIDADADNVRLYFLCVADVARIQPIGVARPVQLAQELLIV